MYKYNCKIRRVVDGDTVDVDIDLGFNHWLHNERIRLYGIDAPESRTLDPEEKKHGFAAKEFVEQQLIIGAIHRLRTNEKGKYGRYLGTITLIDSEQTINDLLIDQLLAVPYNGQSREKSKSLNKINWEKIKHEYSE